MASAASSRSQCCVDVVDADEVDVGALDLRGAVAHGFGLHPRVAEAAVVDDRDGALVGVCVRSC